MKSIVSSLVAACVIIMSGCSSADKTRIASGSFSYIKAEEASEIKVPEGLDSPEYTRDFELPELGENAPTEYVGKQLTIVSPSLVLPLVRGSYIQEGSKSAKIKFDKVDDSKALDTTIWDTVLSFLDENEIAVESFSPEEGTLITDWMLNDDSADRKWYQFFKDTNATGRKFEFSLKMAPHGRTAELGVELKDYLKTVNDEVVGSMENTLARSEEVDVLNKIVTHYEYEIGVQISQIREQIKQGLDTELGFNADGDPAYIVDGIYDVTWPRLQLVLLKLGFDVKDLDKSNGLVFVSYAGPGGGWWTNLFSSGESLLGLGDYRLKVQAQGTKTAVTFMTDESEVFDVKQVTDLFEPFSSTMAKNNLDI